MKGEGMKKNFKALFSKKYPERAGKDGRGLKRVYMGPPPSLRKAKEEDSNKFEDVYAGPPEDEIMSAVYMGPPEDAPVPVDEQGAGTDQSDDEMPKDLLNGPPTMATVYAGPAQMSEFYRKTSEMRMVYAGPAQMSGTNRNPSEFLMAYAGPQKMKGGFMDGSYMNPFGIPPMATEQPPRTDTDNGLLVYRLCPACGNKCSDTAKFCPECGSLLKDVPVTDKRDGQDPDKNGEQDPDKAESGT